MIEVVRLANCKHTGGFQTVTHHGKTETTRQAYDGTMSIDPSAQDALD
jgi:hypothetical protein